MNKIGISLIGIGGYGSKLALAMEETGMYSFVTCYHPDPEKNRAGADRYGCVAATGTDDAFMHDGVEAVVIATPDHTHSSYIKKALACNRHVFVDKPMVATSDEAFLVRDELKHRKDLVFMVGHNMRREPAFRWIKTEYDAGRLGRMVTFEIVLSHGGAFNWTADYWRTKPELCREGPMRVNGVHASDVVEYLFGPIGAVYSRLGNFSGQPAPDSGVTMVDVDGASGVIYTHWVVPSLNRFTFQFTEALVEFNLQHLFVRRGRDIDCIPTNTEEVPLPASSARIDQMREFAGAVKNGGSFETGWYEGYRAVAFFEACYRSYVEGRSISLKGQI